MKDYHDNLIKFFPQRNNWIIKPNGGNWSTRKYEISDHKLIELWQSDEVTIGLRPGNETYFFALDIDKNSPYHYNQDPNAIGTITKIFRAKCKLLRPIIIQSSNSTGVHIYYPFHKPLNTDLVVNTVYSVLVNAGYTIAAGTLELFPNKRSSSGVNYNPLRLPFQTGSYILNDEFQRDPVDNEHILTTWYTAAGVNTKQGIFKPENVVESAKVEKTIVAKEIVRQRYQEPTGVAPDWMKEFDQTVPGMWRHLQTIAKVGFTDIAQTNYLILTCTRLFYILGGVDDFRAITHFIRLLPNFDKFCNHKKELEKRVKDAVKNMIENKKYYPIRFLQTLQKYSKNVLQLLRKQKNTTNDVTERLRNACKQVLCEKDLSLTVKTNFMTKVCELAKSSMSTVTKYWETIICEFYQRYVEQNKTRCNPLQGKAYMLINHYLLSCCVCVVYKYLIRVLVDINTPIALSSRSWYVKDGCYRKKLTMQDMLAKITPPKPRHIPTWEREILEHLTQQEETSTLSDYLWRTSKRTRTVTC